MSATASNTIQGNGVVVGRSTTKLMESISSNFFSSQSKRKRWKISGLTKQFNTKAAIKT